MKIRIFCTRRWAIRTVWQRFSHPFSALKRRSFAVAFRFNALLRPMLRRETPQASRPSDVPSKAFANDWSGGRSIPPWGIHRSTSFSLRLTRPLLT